MSPIPVSHSPGNVSELGAARGPRWLGSTRLSPVGPRLAVGEAGPPGPPLWGLQLCQPPAPGLPTVRVASPNIPFQRTLRQHLSPSPHIRTRPRLWLCNVTVTSSQTLLMQSGARWHRAHWEKQPGAQGGRGGTVRTIRLRPRAGPRAARTRPQARGPLGPYSG